MSYIVMGNIPNKITYTFYKEKEVFVGCTWDINSDKIKYDKIKVLPTYVSDTDPNNIKRAQQWAANWETQNTVISVEADNTPIKNIRLLSLEFRGRNGRAYKAIIDKYYIDFREDVLMDTILQVGISPGGILQGEFIWAKLSSQMKLIRIGSELHRMILEFESNKNAKPISKDALEIGGVYQNKKKNKAIFLGYINTTILYKKDKPPYYNGKNATFDFNHKEIKKAMLFYDISYGSLEKNIRAMKNQESEDFKFIINKTHSYIEKIDQVKVDSKEIISLLRERVIRKIKTKILQFTGYEKPEKGFNKPSDVNIESSITFNSKMLNIYSYEDNPVDIFDIKKYLIFS